MSKNIKSDKGGGKLAFVPAEQAEQIMPSNWRFTLNNPQLQADIRARFPEFRNQVCSVNRHDLLSLTALYVLLGGHGVHQREGHYPEVAELEYLQAIALTEPARSDLQKVLFRDDVSSFWRELATQYHVASDRRLEEAGSGLETMALSHTAYYRNPYGNAFFDRMILRICEEYDDRYVRTGQLTKVGEAIAALRQEIWSRFQSFHEKLVIALTGSRREILENIRQSSPHLPSDTSAEYAKLEMRDLRIVAYQAEEDAAVRELFRLDSIWITKQEDLGLPMRSLIERLSIDKIEAYDPASLAFSNPVHEAPIVKDSEGYALYSPLTLTSFPFAALLVLLNKDEQAKSRLEKIRGWFVEQEAARLMRETFPSAQVILGGYWKRATGERIESDLLVLVANRLLIMEAKGAIIPERVRAGAKDATVQFLRRIWGKASRQSNALAGHIMQATVPVEIFDAAGRVLLNIDATKLRSMSRFGVSVEQVGPLMNTPALLREVNVLDKEVVPAPCIILSELEQVFKHAATELGKLHYLTRRATLASTYEIVGDEMDVYTTYLQFGFSNLPQSDHRLMLLGASYTLHEYMGANGKVRPPSDSALRCSPYFKQVLKYMEQRKTPAFLEVGLMLLDMPFAQQQNFERQMDQTFRKKPRSGDWPIAIAQIDVLGEISAICVALMDPRTSVEERRQVGFDVLSGVRDRMQATNVVCFIRLWKDDAPYDALYMGGNSVVSLR